VVGRAGWGDHRGDRRRRRGRGLAAALHGRRPGAGYVADESPEVAIALEPDFTGRGLGKKLMAAALDFARDRGAPAVSLTVDENNERAYRAYLGIGFEFTAGNAEAEGYRVMVHRF
jgi:GNAT superfamily N-acetyltransferase